VIGVLVDFDVEVEGAGLSSAAISVSIVEEPVVDLIEAGVVEIVGAGRDAGGSGAAAVVCVVLLVLPEPVKSPPSAVPRLCPSCRPNIIFIKFPVSELLPKRPFELLRMCGFVLQFQLDPPNKPDCR